MTQQEFKERYNYNLRTDNIGGGSFGTVYKAYDNKLDREVAIKVSEVKKVGEKEFSLQEEFNAVKDIPVHQNIANYEAVYRFDAMNGIFDYAIMQYYPLGNLSSYLKNNTTTFKVRESLVLGILDGISHLHTYKVVHRDLKPSNILVVDRRGKLVPKITDFGLSKQADNGQQSKFTNSFAGGTLQYSSPEQLKGKPLKLNTDLWSFGVIAYEILTQKVLFDSESSSTASAEWQNEVTQKILNENISSKLTELPDNWKQVIGKCLERPVSKRVQNVNEISSLLLIGKAKEPTQEKVSSTAETVIFNTKETTAKETVVAAPKKKESPKKEPLQKQTTKKATTKKIVTWAAIVISALSISVGAWWYPGYVEESKYFDALQTDTITAIENFLKEYPDSKFAPSAKKRIDYLKEKKKKSTSIYDSLIFDDSASKPLISWEIKLKDQTANAITQTKNGNYLFAINNSGSSIMHGLTVKKINKDGKEIWKKTHYLNFKPRTFSIKQTKDNGYALIGSAGGVGENFFLKIKADGSKEWLKIYKKKNINFRFSSFSETNNGFILATNNLNYYFLDDKKKFFKSWVFKIDNIGNIEWEKIIDNKSSENKITYVKEMNNGDFLMAGAKQNNPWFLNFSKNGNLKNERVSNLKSQAYQKFTFNNNNFIFLNRKEIFSGSIDNNFKIINEKKTAIKESLPFLNFSRWVSNSNIIYALRKNEITKKSVVYKLNLQGDKIWQKELKTHLKEFVNEMYITNDGGVVILDGKRVVKLDRNGNL